MTVTPPTTVYTLVHHFSVMVALVKMITNFLLPAALSLMNSPQWSFGHHPHLNTQNTQNTQNYTQNTQNYMQNYT